MHLLNCFFVFTGRLNDPHVADLAKSLPFVTLVHQTVAAGSCEMEDPRGSGYPPAMSAIVDGLGREGVREVWKRGVRATVGGCSRLEVVCSLNAVLVVLGTVYRAAKVLGHTVE